MPDEYTLQANINGDSKSFNKAADNAKKSADQLGDSLDDLAKKPQTTSKGFEKLQSKLSSVGSKMKSIGTKMSIGLTAPLTLAGKNAITAASDFDESLNKVDVAFGESSQQVKDWANTALESFGLSKNQALEATSLFGDMGTSMGLTKKEAANMATSLSGLAGDLASFKNVGIDQAMTALNGVFTGETESLKQLGIVMTETNLEEFAEKTGKVYKEMSQAEKVQLRYNYVMEMSKNAQGDYARTSEGTANSIRTFQGSVDNLMIALGQNLLPIFTPLVQGATDLVNKFAEADPWVQKLVIGFGLVVAAGGPLLIFFGSAASGLSSMITLGIKLAPAMTKLGGVFSGVLNPKMLLIIGTITAIIAIGYLLITHWEELKQSASDSWTWIQNKFQAFDNWLSSVFAIDWSKNFGAFGDILNSFSHTVSGVWNGIKRTFSGIIDFIAGIFTGNWKRAWQGIVDIFGGIFGGIGAIAKAPLNGVIGLVNSAISGINSISVDIPDWVPFAGGEHFGLDIPKIPYLLHGTKNFQGGFARMNEGGRGELTYLPNGTQVIPHDISVTYAKEAARLHNSGTPIDLSNILDGMIIQVDNSVRVGDRTLKDDIANYTIKKIGNQYKAILAKKGA